ncbi:MAG: hypothetical protein PHV37_06620 [Candidatus Gastranaerophilales bacterium]|nr:hypothetical protein [Candidatus Gastranaerophilales bacterium]
MKKILLLTLICTIFVSTAFASTTTKKYIKNSKGQTTGYTKTYSNGKTVQYNKKGQTEFVYKKSSNGTVTKYSKTGKKLETYK